MRTMTSVSPFPESRCLSYNNFVRECVGGFPSPGQARVVVNDRDTYTGLPAIPSIFLLRDIPNWSQVREETTRYFG